MKSHSIFKNPTSTLTLVLALALFLAFSLLLFGCTGFGPENDKSKEKTGLQIYSMSTGLGSISNDNLDQQRLTYSIHITNENDTEDYIQWVEPILGEGIKDKVVTENLQIGVEKTISAKGDLEVAGEIVFNTQGLTKDEVINLEPFITGIKVGSKKVIVINTLLEGTGYNQ